MILLQFIINNTTKIFLFSSPSPQKRSYISLKAVRRYTFQSCGSGSGIRCLFDPWIRISDPGSRISDPGSRIPDLGSRIPDLGSRISDPGSQTHIFESLVTIFWVKSSIILQEIGPDFFLQHSNKIMFNQFCEICGYIIRFDNKFFFIPLFCCCFWIRDPG